MAGTRGIQNSVSFDLVDQLMGEIQDLRAEVMELRASRRNEASFLIKIVSDEEAPIAGFDPNFIFAVPFDVDGLYLEDVEAFVTTVGTTSTTIRLENDTQLVTITSPNLTILAGQKHSSPTYVLDNPARQVFWKDQIFIQVMQAGAGARGLGVILKFM